MQTKGEGGRHEWMVPSPNKTDIDALILFEQRVNLVNGPVILLQLARILVPLQLTNFYPGSTQGGHSAVAGWSWAPVGIAHSIKLHAMLFRSRPVTLCR